MLSGLPEPREAEAWSFLQALHSIDEIGLRIIIFELDYKTVVDGVVAPSTSSSDFHLILSKRRVILTYNYYQNSLVNFIRR